MNASNNTSKDLRIVFAIGGKSLTLSEMQAIAHALADFLPRYGGDGIDLVRDDLVRMVTD